jgi:hypothetical protein
MNNIRIQLSNTSKRIKNAFEVLLVVVFCDILVLGDFNLPKVEWGVQEDGSTLVPMGVTTDLESDLIESMLCCDLGQINSIPNQNGTFLDLIFSNAGTDITVEICESPLLGLDRQHRAYELLVDVG